jgi:crotonobetainyl-CoA:carnitine CoA-transferase CaiB-like acyl-CoA transferase
VNSIDAALTDPQVASNRMVVDLQHPDYGTIKVVGTPVKLEGTPGSMRLPPPRIGEHTHEVLADLGFTRDEIDALASAKTRS